jgi:CHAD domain-containing protein
MKSDLHRWRSRLEQQARKVATSGTPEAIHQVRVATRRLRCALELLGRRALIDDVRALCRDLGPARDLHLMEAMPPLRPWARTQMGQAQADVVNRLASARTRGLLDALRALPAEELESAWSRLARMERRLLRALDQRHAASAETWAEATHRVRRLVRRLRYAREALGLASPELEAAQEALGSFCDVLAVRRLIVRWAAETGVDARAAVARLDAALSGPRRPVTAAPAPPPRPGSPGRRPARSRGGRRAPSPSSS